MPPRNNQTRAGKRESASAIVKDLASQILILRCAAALMDGRMVMARRYLKLAALYQRAAQFIDAEGYDRAMDGNLRLTRPKRRGKGGRGK
jgi:hypothetical protein